MPQLLLEILSEEIPARMQAKAQADLERALMDRLTAAGLIPEAIKGFSGPRRLVAVVDGLPVKSADVVEDVQGPKEGAPDAAIQGFLRKAGLASIDQAHLHDVPKKGRIYLAHVRKPGRETASLIAEMVPAIVREFHWPKSMRWGPNSTNSTGELRWVRPISRVLCTFDGEVVPFEIDGIRSGNLTEGHRIMGRGPFQVRRFDDYEDVVRNKGRVILDREERKEIIQTDARTLCAAQNLEWVDDPGLLDEVAGLAEHPVVLIGDMDKAFLDLPPEVIKLSMRTHQKYFAVRDPQKGKEPGGLAPKFIVVANLAASDGGEMIAAGNSRVLSARLNDARFFWDNDRKVSLESRFDKLGDIVFHEKLGSVKDKAERVMALARHLAPLAGADPDQAERAAKLAKSDLVSDMVGEFAELEGVMGRYYALLQGEPQAVADAVRDHYKPKGPGDVVPSDPVSVAVALADKIDTLVAFWAIDEKPTGSRDPYALRRAALGVIRIVLGSAPSVSESWAPRHLPESSTGGGKAPGVASTAAGGGGGSPRLRGETEGESVRLGLRDQIVRAYESIMRPICERGLLLDSQRLGPYRFEQLASEEFRHRKFELDARISGWGGSVSTPMYRIPSMLSCIDSLLAFLADRLKVHLREQGARHDLIDAVFAPRSDGSVEDDLVLIVKRVEALGMFLDTGDGKNLLAGYKRAANILKAEEKKDGASYSQAANPALFDLDEERALHAALAKVAPEASSAIEAENFAGAMRALSNLRGPVDAFFDKVTVNADEPDVRTNRLRLLSQIRDALGRVADFSRIEG